MKEEVELTEGVPETPIRIVKLSRRWWLRGNPNISCLLHPTTGQMCCLGFDAIDRGTDPRDLVLIDRVYTLNPHTLRTPASLAEINEEYSKSMRREGLLIPDRDIGNAHSEALSTLMAENDCDWLNDAERVENLNAVCAKYSLTFRFELED